MAKILSNSRKQPTLISILPKLEFIKKSLLLSPVVMVSARLNFWMLENGLTDKTTLLQKRKWIFPIPSLENNKSIFRVDNYAVASTSDSFYLIGGFAQSFDGPKDYSTKIACYSNDEWSLAGNLAVGRYGHAAISFQGETLVIGGYTAK